MFDSLFGGEPSPVVKFFIIFIVALGLIGAALWLIRRYGTNRLGAGAARGRQPRLAIIDAAVVDGRRRLVLIRRDNVEHLLMIGGPSDVVVEQNIVRAVPVASSREPVMGRAAGTEQGMRAADFTPTTPAGWAPEPNVRAQRSPTLDDPSWPPVEAPAPRAPRLPINEEPASIRNVRGTLTEDIQLPRSPRIVPSDELSSLRPERVAPAEEETRPTPPDSSPRLPRSNELSPRPAPLPEPQRAAPIPVIVVQEAPRAPVRPASEAASPFEPRAMTEPRTMAPSSSPDTNLTDMAQRLEAALRRPMIGDNRNVDAAAKSAPPVEIDPRAAALLRMSQTDAKPSSLTPQPQKPASSGSVFDSLEEEMANLLGRPPAGKE